VRTAPALTLLFALALTGCGDDAGDDAADGPTTETTALPTTAGNGDDGGSAGAGEGTIAVRLEETEGILIEGFELGLRFTDAATGEEIDRVLWSDYVASLGSDDIEAYYTSVLEQPVPAGTVRVGADLNVGIGPPPAPPDLDATPLPCELDVEVAAGETVTVVVAFDDTAPECLQVADT
jgi:hypothetical protein